MAFQGYQACYAQDLAPLLPATIPQLGGVLRAKFPTWGVLPSKEDVGVTPSWCVHQSQLPPFGVWGPLFKGPPHPTEALCGLQRFIL